jgi:DNA-binding NarL/FixJ family response regulator
LALCEQAGAERVARLARAELAAAGGRRRRRQAPDSAELTGQEERVATLVAQGMTNAQVGSALGLSPKTIGHYLERIYAKLGIRSRHELMAYVHRERWQ